MMRTVSHLHDRFTKVFIRVRLVQRLNTLAIHEVKDPKVGHILTIGLQIASHGRTTEITFDGKREFFRRFVRIDNLFIIEIVIFDVAHNRFFASGNEAYR